MGFFTNEKAAFGAPGPRGAEMLGEDQVLSRGTQGVLSLERPAGTEVELSVCISVCKSALELPFALQGLFHP